MNRIKILREELKMTQQELADKLDGAKSTIAMYENETRKPSLEVLIKLSDIFGCSIDYLLGKSNYKNESDYIDNNMEQALLTADNVEYLMEKYPNFNADNIVNTMLQYYKNNQNYMSYLNEVVNKFALEDQKKVKQVTLYLYNMLLCSPKFANYLSNQPSTGNSNLLEVHYLKENNSLANTSFYMCPLYNEILSEKPYWLDTNIKGRIVLDTNIYKLTHEQSYFSIEVNENYTNFRTTYGRYIIFQKQNNAKDDDIILTVIENSKPCIKKYKKLSDTLVMLQPIDSTDVLEPLVIDIINTTISILGIAIGYFGKIE